MNEAHVVLLLVFVVLMLFFFTEFRIHRLARAIGHLLQASIRFRELVQHRALHTWLSRGMYALFGLVAMGGAIHECQGQWEILALVVEAAGVALLASEVWYGQKHEELDAGMTEVFHQCRLYLAEDAKALWIWNALDNTKVEATLSSLLIEARAQTPLSLATHSSRWRYSVPQSTIESLQYWREVTSPGVRRWRRYRLIAGGSLIIIALSIHATALEFAPSTTEHALNRLLGSAQELTAEISQAKAVMAEQGKRIDEIGHTISQLQGDKGAKRQLQAPRTLRQRSALKIPSATCLCEIPHAF